ncbi:hypothetical protein [Streptomyces sp. NPDC051994]|uniref:hypothetical protein n=1 Tax=unclassified Streptomyces TaxID=2593676 RepID=UPI003442D6CC
MRWPKLSLPRPRRGPVSDLVDLAGLGCLDTAAWWLHPVAGMAFLGGVLLLIGWVVGREPPAQSD